MGDSGGVGGEVALEGGLTTDADAKADLQQKDIAPETPSVLPAVPENAAAEDAVAEDVAAEDAADGAPARPISPQHQALRAKVRRVLNFHQRRMLDTRENNCWELMHQIVAYGVQSEVRRGSARGPAVNSIAWLCSGAACNGQSLMYLDRGKLTAAKGPRVQGHHGQFLAILAQSKVMLDYPILVGGRQFSVADLIETEKLSCESGMELTFKLIAFSYYLDSEETWSNAKGEQWSIPRLIREEIAAPINGAPCGGTHRLMGLSYAVRERQRQELPIDGEYLRAQTYTEDFHRYTFRLQNRDGSFSTEWFKRPAAKEDIERRLQTSGHILEWLAYSVPDETLDDPRFIKAVAYLAGMLDAGGDHKWSIGPLGHGLHSLALYEERMQRREQSQPAPRVARSLSHRRSAPSESETQPSDPQPTEPEPSEAQPTEPQPSEPSQPEAERPTGPAALQPVLIPATAPRRGAGARESSSPSDAPALDAEDAQQD